MTSPLPTPAPEGDPSGGIGGQRVRGPNGELRVQPIGTRTRRRRRLIARAMLSEARQRLTLAQASNRSAASGDIEDALAMLHELVKEARGGEQVTEVVVSEEGVDVKTRIRQAAAKRRQGALAARDILYHHREMARMAMATKPEADAGGGAHGGDQHLHVHLHGPQGESAQAAWLGEVAAALEGVKREPSPPETTDAADDAGA